MRPAFAILFAGLTLATPTLAIAKAPDYAAAVADTKRPAEARALDENRKPAETLRFLGLKSGMQAADIMTGSGYWAEIMVDLVGPGGKVTGFEPAQFTADEKGKKAWTDLAARLPGITWTNYPFEAFAAPADSFDFTIINMSYHDLYWQSDKYGVPRTDPAAFVKTL